MDLDIPGIMKQLALKQNKKLMYQGQEVTADEAFALDGLLPIFTRRANMLSDFLFEEPLKVSYPPDDHAKTGCRLEVKDDQRKFVLLMLLYDILEEMAINSGEGEINITE